MVLRFLFLFFLFYLVYSLIKLYLSSRKGPRHPRPRSDSAAAEEMVLDPQCRSYLPKREATLRGGHYFCSEECARLYLAHKPS